MAKDPDNIAGVFSKVVYAVTPDGVEQFRNIVSDPAALNEFFAHSSRAVEFLLSCFLESSVFSFLPVVVLPVSLIRT
jgi:hypothetical protein